jgi:hypothetical protein
MGADRSKILALPLSFSIAKVGPIKACEGLLDLPVPQNRLERPLFSWLMLLHMRLRLLHIVPVNVLLFPLL